MSLSTYQANRLLNYSFGNTSYTPEANLYLGFASTASISPGLNGIILMAYEPRPYSGVPITNYSRIEIPNTKSYWSVSGASTLYNLQNIISPEALVDWGTLRSLFITDSLINGNMLYYHTLTTPITVLAGESIMMYPGDLVIEVG